MDEISATLHRLGVPSSVIAIIAVTWIFIREFKPFQRPARRSDREILSQDEQSFRQSILDRLKVTEARGEASEQDRAKLRVEVAECEKRHIEAAEKFEQTVSDLRDDLSACEDRHVRSDKRYDALAGKFTELVQSVKARGLDLLFDMSDIAPGPTEIDTLLYRGPDRRDTNIPVAQDRRAKPPAGAS
jgi:hypothetical protein